MFTIRLKPRLHLHDPIECWCTLTQADDPRFRGPSNQELDDRISAWHNGVSAESLHDFLGWSWEEYREWGRTCTMPNRALKPDPWTCPVCGKVTGWELLDHEWRLAGEHWSDPTAAEPRKGYVCSAGCYRKRLNQKET